MCLKKEHSGKKKYTCMPLLPKSLVTVKLEKCEFFGDGACSPFFNGNKTIFGVNIRAPGL